MAATVRSFLIPHYFASNLVYKPQPKVKIRCLASRDSTVWSADSVGVNGVSFVLDEERVRPSVDLGNGHFRDEMKEEEEDCVQERLKPLWDDGYGTASLKDYLDLAKEMIKPDGGPPRWFTPLSCGAPLKDSPLLLFLPGIDGLGMGLILHHKALGKVFEVWCMHIPVYDQTPFEELIKFVERTIRSEHASRLNTPIYLVGDSFGGCLALAVAARNPTIDLILILANPATSFDRSQLQPFLPLLESLPEQLHATVPYLLSFVMGDPTKMAAVNIDTTGPPRQVIEQFSGNLTALLPRLSLCFGS